MRKQPERYIKKFILKINGRVINVDPEGNFKKDPDMIRLEEAVSRKVSAMLNPVDLPGVFKKLAEEEAAEIKGA